MGLGQLLNVICARSQRIVEDLNGADLQFVQENLCILRVVFGLTWPQWGHGPCDYPIRP